MAVKQLTYKDIPQRKREKAAAKAALEVKVSIVNAVTEEQRAKHVARLEILQKWAAGQLPVIDRRARKAEAGEELKAEKKATRKGKAHKVSISEKLSLEEN
jgi:hypothetical protein